MSVIRRNASGVRAISTVSRPADGQIVHLQYGCGAHSQATLVVDEATEVVRTARYDTGAFDVLTD